MDVPEYGVRAKRGDFEPLISEDLFYRVLSVLSGRLPSIAARQRTHPDLPLRGFVRCEPCGRGALWQPFAHPKCRFAKARPEPDFR